MRIGNLIVDAWEFDWNAKWIRNIRPYNVPNVLRGFIAIESKFNHGNGTLYYFYFSKNNPFIKAYDSIYKSDMSVVHRSELFDSFAAAKDRVDLFLSKIEKLKVFL